MTVKELKERLEEFPPDALIILWIEYYDEWREADIIQSEEYSPDGRFFIKDISKGMVSITVNDTV